MPRVRADGRPADLPSSSSGPDPDKTASRKREPASGDREPAAASGGSVAASRAGGSGAATGVRGREDAKSRAQMFVEVVGADDIDTTADLRSSKPAGSFPRRLPPAPPSRPPGQFSSLLPGGGQYGASGGPGGPGGSGGSGGKAPGKPAAAAPGPRGLLGRASELPVRIVYTVGATIATVVIVLLIFVVFSGDEARNKPDGQAGAEVVVRDSGAATPSPAAIVVPAAPKAKALPVYAGAGSVVIGLVDDAKAGLGYSRLGAPWVPAASTPFSTAQRVGKWRAPYTMLVSGQLPGTAPKSLTGDAALRKAAVSGAKWALRTYHPAGATLAWTGSARIAGGKGWALTYTATYQIDGRKRTSRTAIAVADIGRAKPGMVLMTVPDTRKALWPDIAKVVNGITIR
ncbi:hypothetical protein P3X83_00315 (plasmid) [Spongiactinospora sp. TRM90649]|nr:hypothetical protein [Spongiactinospora sp. TRM90649]